MSDPDDVAALLEERPTGDFIDGYLAALATMNAALAGAPEHSLFYSFDWIGDGSETQETSLLNAFQAEPEQMRFAITPLSDWRAETEELAEKWLGRDLAPAAARAIAREFVEIMEAFLAEQPAEAFRVIPSGDVAALGRSFDHVMFESLDGRLLLEFSEDA